MRRRRGVHPRVELLAVRNELAQEVHVLFRRAVYETLVQFLLRALRGPGQVLVRSRHDVGVGVLGVLALHHRLEHLVDRELVGGLHVELRAELRSVEFPQERPSVQDAGVEEGLQLLEPRRGLLRQRARGEDFDFEIVDRYVLPRQGQKPLVQGDLHRIFALFLGNFAGAVDELACDVKAPRFVGAAEDDEALRLDIVEGLQPDTRVNACRLLTLSRHLREANVRQCVGR